MRIALAAALIAVITPAHSAWGQLTRAELDGVYVAPPAGAHLDLDLSARDTHGKLRTLGDILGGRSGFVSFVDYTCNTLCGTDLALLSTAVAQARLAPSEYRLVVVGIDPKDSAVSATEMEKKEIPRTLWPVTTLLLPDKQTVLRSTSALGFHYVYDPAIDQFAHPAVVYVIGPDGALRRTLSPFALAGTDLRRALDASAPASDLYQRVRMLCYSYDPATGIYSLRIDGIVKAACLFTVLLLCTAVLLLIRLRRKTG
jgi:protein SCO1/2